MLTVNAATTTDRQIRLSPRERQILGLLCEGLPNKLICRELGISEGTVKVHLGKIFRALGVSSRLQAVLVARDACVRPFAASGPAAGTASQADPVAH